MTLAKSLCFPGHKRAGFLVAAKFYDPVTLQLGADKRLRPCPSGPELPWADGSLQEGETHACLMLEKWMAIGMKILALGQLSPAPSLSGILAMF